MPAMAILRSSLSRSVVPRHIEAVTYPITPSVSQWRDRATVIPSSVHTPNRGITSRHPIASGGVRSSVIVIATPNTTAETAYWAAYGGPATASDPSTNSAGIAMPTRLLAPGIARAHRLRIREGHRERRHYLRVDLRGRG